MAAIWQEIVFWWRQPLICNNTVEINETVLILSVATVLKYDLSTGALKNCYPESFGRFE